MFDEKKIVRIERETYEAIIKVFRDMKVERMRNLENAEKLEKDMESLEKGIANFATKIEELKINISGLEKSFDRVGDEYQRKSLRQKAETLIYNTTELEDGIFELDRKIKYVKMDLNFFRKDGKKRA